MEKNWLLVADNQILSQTKEFLYKVDVGDYFI
jgi:hypothetical protein